MSTAKPKVHSTQCLTWPPPLRGSVHGSHWEHIGIQQELSAVSYAQGCRQRDTIFFSRDSRGDNSGRWRLRGKASFVGTVLTMRPSTMNVLFRSPMGCTVIRPRTMVPVTHGPDCSVLCLSGQPVIPSAPP